MANKKRRGLKFTIRKCKSLVKFIDKLLAISITEWEWVWDRHMTCYPEQNWTLESLKGVDYKYIARKRNNTNCILIFPCVLCILCTPF
jgi:hypothetical protein